MSEYIQQDCNRVANEDDGTNVQRLSPRWEFCYFTLDLRSENGDKSKRIPLVTLESMTDKQRHWSGT